MNQQEVKKVRFINEEQRKQMERHRWICSEKVGYDIGETGYYDWVKKYAQDFRNWVEDFPFECVRCGYCAGAGGSGMCQYPFNEKRIGKIYDT